MGLWPDPESRRVASPGGMAGGDCRRGGRAGGRAQAGPGPGVLEHFPALPRHGPRAGHRADAAVRARHHAWTGRRRRTIECQRVSAVDLLVLGGTVVTARPDGAVI